MYLFHGTARKIAILPVVLSVIGWVIFVVGFGIGLRDRQRYGHNDYKPSSPQYYPFWAATCAGPLLFIGAFAHAAIKPRPWGAVIQALTCFVSVVYLTAVGAVLFLDGVQIYEGLKSESLDPDEPSKFKEYSYLPIEATGCLFSALFWAVLIAIWPFYADQKESEVSSKSPNSYYQYEETSA